MSLIYTVTSVTENSVTVVPSEKEVGCNGNCSNCTSGISVDNPGKFNLKCGDKVKISSLSNREKIKGIVSLLVPVVCAVCGYFLPKLLFNNESENIKAVSVLVCLALASTVVFFTSRKNKYKNKLEITAVIS